jgi:hypothetical protein
MKYLLALAILIATAIGHAAEVIPIKPIQDCFERPRELRRLQRSREWSHEQEIKPICT